MPNTLHRISDPTRARPIGTPFLIDEWTPFHRKEIIPGERHQGNMTLHLLELAWRKDLRIEADPHIVVPFTSIVTTTVEKFGFEVSTTFDVLFDKRWALGTIRVTHANGDIKDTKVRVLHVGEFVEASLHPFLEARAV